jgi:hypothetical protein
VWPIGSSRSLPHFRVPAAGSPLQPSLLLVPVAASFVTAHETEEHFELAQAAYSTPQERNFELVRLITARGAG